MSGADMNPAPHEARIAIVGIGCRTPGARSAAQRQNFKNSNDKAADNG